MKQSFIHIFRRIIYSRIFLASLGAIADINTSVGCSSISVGLENILGWTNLNCRWNSFSLGLSLEGCHGCIDCSTEKDRNGTKWPTCESGAPLDSKAKIANVKTTKINSLAMLRSFWNWCILGYIFLILYTKSASQYASSNIHDYIWSICSKVKILAKVYL